MKGVTHCLLSVQRKEHLRKGVPRGVGIPNDPVQVSWRKFAYGNEGGGLRNAFPGDAVRATAARPQHAPPTTCARPGPPIPRLNWGRGVTTSLCFCPGGGRRGRARLSGRRGLCGRGRLGHRGRACHGGRGGLRARLCLCRRRRACLGGRGRLRARLCLSRRGCARLGLSAGGRVGRTLSRRRRPRFGARRRARR